MSSLEEAFWSMFVEEELFEGNNLYRCAQCDRLVTAAKVGVGQHIHHVYMMLAIQPFVFHPLYDVLMQSAKLRKLPPFLTVSLLRFSFDFAKCERYKETGRYTFPFRINLQPFCEQVYPIFLLLFLLLTVTTLLLIGPFLPSLSD